MTLKIPPMADIKPTLLSTVVVGVMAVIFILFLKFAAFKFNVQPLKDIAAAI